MTKSDPKHLNDGFTAPRCQTSSFMPTQRSRLRLPLMVFFKRLRWCAAAATFMQLLYGGVGAASAWGITSAKPIERYRCDPELPPRPCIYQLEQWKLLHCEAKLPHHPEHAKSTVHLYLSICITTRPKDNVDCAVVTRRVCDLMAGLFGWQRLWAPGFGLGNDPGMPLVWLA